MQFFFLESKYSVSVLFLKKKIQLSIKHVQIPRCQSSCPLSSLLIFLIHSHLYSPFSDLCLFLNYLLFIFQSSLSINQFSNFFSYNLFQFSYKALLKSTYSLEHHLFIFWVFFLFSFTIFLILIFFVFYFILQFFRILKLIGGQILSRGG